MGLITYVHDPKAVRISVYYEGTSTVREGMPVCYNYDTTTNWTSVDKNGTAGTFDTSTAEGYQNEGKFIRVEDPTEFNLNWFAGEVAAGSPGIGVIGPCTLDIFVPNGAIVPIRTNANCVVGITSLGVGTAGTYFEQVTGDGDPIPCAVAMETVDRSGTAGLVLAKVFSTGRSVSGLDGFFSPSAKNNGRTYGFIINGDNFFQGVAGAQEYLVHMEGWKSVIASGDCYGGILKISGGNDVVQPTSYILRGINANVSNDGTLGQLDNFIGVKNDEGTCTTVTALSLRAENYGTNAGTGSVFGGLDILLTPEGTMAEKSFGIRVRNNNASLATAVASVLEVSESGANTGFTNLLYVPTAADLGIIAASGDIVFSSADKLIPIKVGSTTYYLVATDNV